MLLLLFVAKGSNLMERLGCKLFNFFLEAERVEALELLCTCEILVLSVMLVIVGLVEALELLCTFVFLVLRPVILNDKVGKAFIPPFQGHVLGFGDYHSSRQITLLNAFLLQE